jgi:hypothetical protein
MITTQSTTIDGVEFRTTQFSALKAFPLMIRLAKAVGPALASLQGVDGNTDVSTLGAQLGEALAGLDPDSATQLVVDLLASTRAIVGGKVKELGNESAINETFTGRMPIMFKVIGYVVQENFRDFIGGSGSEPTAPPQTTLS